MVSVGDFKQDYVRNARANAKRASQLMSRAMGMDVPDEPLLVIVGERPLTFGKTTQVVPIVDVRHVVARLRGALRC